MANITTILQDKLISIISIMNTLQRESQDIYNAYWKTNANTLITALAADTTPATVETDFTKKNYVDGIIMCENLSKFYSNQAVTQADYLQTIDNIKYAEAVLATALSVSTEEIAKRILQFATDCHALYLSCLEAIDVYFDNEIGDIVAVIDAERMIFGSDMTRADLSDAITMLQQFINFISNSAVTTGNYSATIGKWQRLMSV